MRKVRKYNLALSEEMFDLVQENADQQGMTILEVIRRYIKIGLLLDEHPEATISIIENGKPKEVKII